MHVHDGQNEMYQCVESEISVCYCVFYHCVKEAQGCLYCWMYGDFFRVSVQAHSEHSSDVQELIVDLFNHY